MMQQLPKALQALADYNQFILYQIIKRNDDKDDKIPIDYRTGKIMEKNRDWQNKSEFWTNAGNAIDWANYYGNSFHVGFIFTKNDPFFFVDIDGCWDNVTKSWSRVALDVINLLPGAAVEISQSLTGLHIFGKGHAPDHSCKEQNLGLEFYTKNRFVALTGINTTGNAATDCSAILPTLVNTYFQPKKLLRDESWTTKPLSKWTDPGGNGVIIKKALSAGSLASKFGNTATFRDLWENNTDVLDDVYPPIKNPPNHSYDQSTADAALAQHLAFWTGCNCEHILELMKLSGLVRDKWNWHKSYLTNTIKRAISLQDIVYTAGGDNTETPLTDEHAAKTLQGSVKQKTYAKTIREEKLVECGDNSELVQSLCIKHGPAIQAGFWIDNKNLSVQEIATKINPVTTFSGVDVKSSNVRLLDSYQFLSGDQQIEHFKGCTYIQSIHKVLTPTGAQLKSEQFNATYGGWVFQLDSESSGKTTIKAWDAFTQSQVVRYPYAELPCFKPQLEKGVLVSEDGRLLVNTYVPIQTRKVKGDIAPFMTHLKKIIPVENDQKIILAYMAACVQHKGYKFQWAPLIQGMQGNGKTLLTRAVAFAVGERYTHWPNASEIAEKYNDWLFDKVFIGVEDVHVSDHKQEVIEILKPMITNDRLAKRAMGVSQIMGSICANFMLNMNDKSNFRTASGDRRYAPFYTAQQDTKDLIRDGMTGDYFPKLYNWLRGDGYAIINDFLHTYSIPIELNPCLDVSVGGLANWAPSTSSSNEAHELALGGVEQEIQEAIAEGRQGFMGGWVSSMAIERLLQSLGASRKIPRNKRKDMLKLLNYEPHPALKNGRSNSFIALDNGKPRLFIKTDHISKNLTIAADVIKAYQMAQGENAANYLANKFKKY